MHSTNSTEKMFKRNDRNVMVNFKPDEYMRKMIFQSVTHGVQSSLLWFSGRASRVATRARFLKGLLALIQDHPNPAVRRGGLGPSPGSATVCIFSFESPMSVT